MYQKREKLTDALISKKIGIKNHMNTKRINYNMPEKENHVVITKSWLLVSSFFYKKKKKQTGFLEGDVNLVYFL